MATLIDPDFRARLRALNDKYAASVPSLMQAIAAAQARCDTEGPRLEPLTALHHALHHALPPWARNAGAWNSWRASC